MKWVLITLVMNLLLDNERIFGLEIEGYTKLLLGYFYFEDNQIKFERYLADEVDTEGTSDHYEIYDAPKYDAIWEG